MPLFTAKETTGADDLAKDFHFPTSEKALIIFVRNPELGKCKTRLAKTIGAQNALEVYKCLLEHTASVAKKVVADRYVYYSEHIIREDIWEIGVFRKKLQKGNTLGERMHQAFLELLAQGYKKVAIIGSDLLDLDTELVTKAFDTLNSYDVVMGPAQDGGYYLLGMKKLYPEIFQNKDWGTSSVGKDTLNDLKRSKVHLLKELNDIDTFDDLQQYKQFKDITAKHD